jgi:hypothetical protein
MRSENIIKEWIGFKIGGIYEIFKRTTN